MIYELRDQVNLICYAYLKSDMTGKLVYIGPCVGYGISASILWSGVTEPKREQVRRETFENSKSYIEGKAQELTKYRLEYELQQDSIAKQTIKRTILQSFANFNLELLNEDDRQFIKSLKK